MSSKIMKYAEIIKNIFCRINKKILLFVLMIAVVIILVFFFTTRDVAKNTVQMEAIAKESEFQPDIVFYTGQECPRCKKIEKFIDDNKLADKISLTQKEVLHNSQNNSDMKEKAMECLLDSSNVGLPFLWSKGKCYEGETKVQNFLKKEAGLQ